MGQAEPSATVLSPASLGEELRRRIVELAQRPGTGSPALSDEALLGLEASTPDGALGVLSTTAAGELAGYGALGSHGGTWVIEPLLVPGISDPGATARAIVSGAVEAVAARGGGTVRLWLHDPAPPLDPATLGFRPERELLQLRVPLPLDPSVAGSGTSVRAFRPGWDDAEWLRANNRAFAGHPEQSGWTEDDLRRRIAEPWFDARGFLLHEATGRLAAFCWTKAHRAEGLGEIYVIGVDPDFQGRGLGRAMTAAGLAHLAGRGLRTGMLYVEGSNAAARALYAGLGFTLHHADRSYVAEVAPGPAQPPVDTPTARPIP